MRRSRRRVVGVTIAGLVLAAGFTTPILSATAALGGDGGFQAASLLAAPASSDYDGDGLSDVAIGSPRWDVNGLSNVGAVDIVYGGGQGAELSSSGAQFVAPGSGGAPGTPAANAQFGTAVASGDFNGDSFADLAIGAPANNGASGGSVTVMYGSSDGIAAARATRFTAANVVGSGVTACCNVGYALAVGDFNNDGYADLAVGVDGYSGGRGGVGVLKGGASGLTTTGKQWFTQSSSGVPGASEAGDRFGRSLAAGDFNGDDLSDLAVGVPGEAIGSLAGAGSVIVLPGAGSGLTGSGSKAFNQNTSGVPGGAEANDQFGAAVAALDVDTDDRADLAVGVPGEALGSRVGAGIVDVLLGSAEGLTGADAKYFSQDSFNVPGAVEPNDQFGAAVSLGDVNADGFGDLAVGAPGEDVGSAANAGNITILFGSDGGINGTGGSTGWTQDSTAVGDTVESGDQFGASVRIVNPEPAAVPRAFANVLVGVPGENGGTGGVHLFLNLGGGATPAGPFYTGASFAGGIQAGAGFAASLG